MARVAPFLKKFCSQVFSKLVSSEHQGCDCSATTLKMTNAMYAKARNNMNIPNTNPTICFVFAPSLSKLQQLRQFCDTQRENEADLIKSSLLTDVRTLFLLRRFTRGTVSRRR